MYHILGIMLPMDIMVAAVAVDLKIVMVLMLVAVAAV